MWRERALKVVLVLVGLLFLAAIYPVTDSLWHGAKPTEWGDDMFLAIYFTLGIFLLMAVRNPSAHRSLIAFTAWSSFAHGAVMAVLAVQNASERQGFLITVAILAVTGVVLIVLTPPKESGEAASAT
jgi:peptidoglycan/LPS O-acetylase OafA/YrhL